MKVLIAVGSKHGGTRGIAEAIAEELRARDLTVDLSEAGEVEDISAYDAVVLGSGIYAGTWLPEAMRFAERHRARLAELPVWLFSSGPLGAENPKPHDDPDRLAATLEGVKIRDHRIFAGELDPGELGLGERLIAKVLHAPEGDFRDWDAIRQWAGGIAAELWSECTADPEAEG